MYTYLHTIHIYAHMYIYIYIYTRHLLRLLVFVQSTDVAHDLRYRSFSWRIIHTHTHIHTRTQSSNPSSALRQVDELEGKKGYFVIYLRTEIVLGKIPYISCGTYIYTYVCITVPQWGRGFLKQNIDIILRSTWRFRRWSFLYPRSRYKRHDLCNNYIHASI